MERAIVRWIVGMALAGLFSGLVFAKDGGSGDADSGKMPDDWYKKSVALVVGIDGYENEWPRLTSAVSDAKRMETELVRQGFTVKTLFDDKATKQEILRQLASVLPTKVGPNDRFVFYFAGHGQTESLVHTQLKGSYIMPVEGYIVPADGSRKGGDQWHTYLSLSELNVSLGRYRGKHVVAIFDACFSGLWPVEPASAFTDNIDILKLAVGGNSLSVITAGGAGEQAREGLFTNALIEGMQGRADLNNDTYMTFGELALYTEREVTRANKRQRPRHSMLFGGGQMVFGPRLKAPQPPPKAVLPAKGKGKPALDWVYSRPAKISFTKSEITVAQYWACVVEGVCTPPEAGRSSNWVPNIDSANPVNYVNWEQAGSFCKWVGGRLPTEKEWLLEATNGGDRDSDKTREFPWGNDPVSCEYAICRISGGLGFSAAGCGTNSTWPVCSRTSGNSVSGLCDMSGNVWEWTSTEESRERISVGGGWFDDNPLVFKGGRRRVNPRMGSADLGFRCAASGKPAKGKP
ncbi:MAG: hypothetical protein C4523_20585 [Myxococcales bacterium]|nr:MAG: hypothetical protein C4523_20585 [Myxococcales bacterium]